MDIGKTGGVDTQQALNQTPSQKVAVKAQESAKVEKEILSEISHKQDKEEARKELTQLTKKLNDEISLLSTDIKFGFSDDINGLFVNVVDTKTDKILRQFPSEDAVDIMSKMRELVGMLFDTKG